MEKVFTGISGSQTGGQGVIDISIPELVQPNGNFGTWPLNLPASGNQTEVNLNVPYRFFGITEQLSWLAQFAGQGFEDVSSLANLIMLQEMMLGLASLPRINRENCWNNPLDHGTTAWLERASAKV